MTDHPTTSSETALASARRTLQIESQGLLDLSARLDDSFTQAVAMLLACRGRVVVSGIGKTGHIARKIAATLPRPARRRSSCTRPRPSTGISA